MISLFFKLDDRFSFARFIKHGSLICFFCALDVSFHITTFRLGTQFFFFYVTGVEWTRVHLEIGLEFKKSMYTVGLFGKRLFGRAMLKAD
jgi:hypothetical protein